MGSRMQAQVCGMESICCQPTEKQSRNKNLDSTSFFIFLLLFEDTTYVEKERKTNKMFNGYLYIFGVSL